MKRDDILGTWAACLIIALAAFALTGRTPSPDEASMMASEATLGIARWDNGLPSNGSLPQRPALAGELLDALDELDGIGTVEAEELPEDGEALSLGGAGRPGGDPVGMSDETRRREREPTAR